MTSEAETAAHPLIAEAIAEAVKAGIFRRAQRLNCASAETWAALAEPHSQKAAQILALIEGDKT